MGKNMGTISELLRRFHLGGSVHENHAVWQAITYRNLLRMRVFIVVVAFIAASLACSWYIVRDQWDKFPQYRAFFWIDVAMLGCTPLLGALLYHHWPRNATETNRFHDRLLNVFCFLVLAWMAISSSYEHLATGNVTHYIIAVLSIATIFYIRGTVLLVQYLTTLSIFFFLVLQLGKPDGNIFRQYDNLIIVIPLAWIASRVLFTNYAQNIKDRMDLVQANRQLQVEVAERKRAEEALRASEQRLALHFEQTPLAVIEWDIEFRVMAWNPAAEAIFGYSAVEAMGRHPAELILPQESQAHVDRIWQALLNQKGGVRSDNQNIRKDGRVLYCEWYNTPLVTPQGDVLGVSSLVLDVTERKKAEREKKALEERLARSGKMEALGLLAGGVAHDLNNVLSGIVSYPELLLLEMDKGHPMRQALETINNSGQKAASIVQDLLTLARRGVTIREITNLNDIIVEYLDSPENRKLMAHHPGLVLQTDLESGLPNIIGSPVQIKNMVMNLVSNAAEAQPDGGTVKIVSSSCHLGDGQGNFLEIPPGDYMQLRIEDSGIGISSEDLERIFEPFYTKKVMGRSGTGLGMAVVWGTVQDHDGHIDITTDVGRGTVVKVFLPVTHERKPLQDAAATVEAFRGRGEVVLVVDDIAEQREIATKIIKHLGYQAFAVESGEAAVRFLQERSVDLVVLDMIMDPGIDGLETYRRILSDHPHQKAIITSGFAETSRVKKALKLGAGAYLKKPYMMERLGIAIRDELRRDLDSNKVNIGYGTPGLE
jgi:two-component system cell cycle sensor histidine kinase/response regulator CckA